MPTRRAVAAAALLAVALAALAGCACACWREDSERSLAMARQAFVTRTEDDFAQTARNVEGIPGWFEDDFRNSSHNLRTTVELSFTSAQPRPIRPMARRAYAAVHPGAIRPGRTRSPGPP